MSVEVKVPAVGESISSGVVSVWHKKSGEQVNAGDPLFTLETDKVSTEINAEKDGVLQTLVAEGAEVKIGDVVATIEEGNGGKPEKKAESADAPKPAAAKESAVLSPAARRVVTEEKLDPQEIRGSGKGGRVMKSDAIAAAQKRPVPREEPPAEKAKDDHVEEKPAATVQSESGRSTRK
ncbi:MAG TPA: biotin/lipoyl-containing protein, partial [Chthoniobacterales bacterium]